MHPPISRRNFRSGFNAAQISNATTPLIAFIIILSFSAKLVLQQEQPTDNSQSSADKSSSSSSSSSKLFSESQEYRQALAESIRDWSQRLSTDIYEGSSETGCIRSIREAYMDNKASIDIVDATKMHSDVANQISNMVGWHKKAVEAIARTAESLAGNHTFDKTLRFDYVDVHRIRDVNEYGGITISETGSTYDSPIASYNQQRLSASMLDDTIINTNYLNEQQTTINGNSSSTIPTLSPVSSTSSSEWQTPYSFLTLERHKNFDDILISTEDSAVHIPVHIYPGEQKVMNGIAWSSGLTKVYKDNMVRNPRLTNQYFASYLGFMRLFPAQQWPIPKSEPDLYDARMRPWYVSGASSPKDVVILVDSSGSMTGSRRDIAKGVVFEILDTLTDNDYFTVLKFSDNITPIGVPYCNNLKSPKSISTIASQYTVTMPGQERLSNSFEQPASDQSPHSMWTGGNNNNNKMSNITHDLERVTLLPATGRNIRHIKGNFTITTSGIANFTHALMSAFELLQNYNRSQTLGSQCNQAIMLITDGSPSSFEEIFHRYNYPNIPVRVFTYLIGREVGDVTNTKLMACQNRGYYTHVINLPEVREQVQQYLPVMARPLVLSGLHPVVWTPAYGDLTYLTLNDWVWESKRRERARNILSGEPAYSTSADPASTQLTTSAVPSNDLGAPDGSLKQPDQQDQTQMTTIASSYYAGNGDDTGDYQTRDEFDIFGYNEEECYWQTKRTDLLTTVVQPVYDTKNTSVLVERVLIKNVWMEQETQARTAQIQGVAAADMKISDIVAMAASHKLGPNGYPILLSNNAFVMYHPDLRPIMEPTKEDPDKNSKILKPFFSSIDFSQVEHTVRSDKSPPSSDQGDQPYDFDTRLLHLRESAIKRLTGWDTLTIKTANDCQKRIQTRNQTFYYGPIKDTPFSFMIAIPQPYGAYKVKAQIEIKRNNPQLKPLTSYFMPSNYDLWTVHPDYNYCDGPANNSVTTILDLIQRIERGRYDDIQWRHSSSNPPLFVPGKLTCDKDLVQSFVFDAIVTHNMPDRCSLPTPGIESSVLSMYGVHMSFVATRSGLTRVRVYDSNEVIKRTAELFISKHARTVDETYYARTVDYNMLINETATLISVPFNAHKRLLERMKLIYSQEETYTSYKSNMMLDLTQSDTPTKKGDYQSLSAYEQLDLLINSTVYVSGTQSIIIGEGKQRSVAGVVGLLYDYATFAKRFFNTTTLRMPPSASRQRGGSATLCQNDDGYNTCPTQCGYSNDSIHCFLIDNNGYVVVSEQLQHIGRHLMELDEILFSSLVADGVYYPVKMFDYQATCIRPEEKNLYSKASSSFQSSGVLCLKIILAIMSNLISMLAWFLETLFIVIASLWTRDFSSLLVVKMNGQSTNNYMHINFAEAQQQTTTTLRSSLLPNKTIIRPCEKTFTLYETRPTSFQQQHTKLNNNIFAGKGNEQTTTNRHNQELPISTYVSNCKCENWFVYGQVAKSNLIMLVVHQSFECELNKLNGFGCDLNNRLSGQSPSNNPMESRQILNDLEDSRDATCVRLEREANLHRQKPDTCISHHPEETFIHVCGSASRIIVGSFTFIILLVFMTIVIMNLMIV